MHTVISNNTSNRVISLDSYFAESPEACAMFEKLVGTHPSLYGSEYIVELQEYSVQVWRISVISKAGKFFLVTLRQERELCDQRLVGTEVHMSDLTGFSFLAQNGQDAIFYTVAGRYIYQNQRSSGVYIRDGIRLAEKLI